MGCSMDSFRYASSTVTSPALVFSFVPNTPLKVGPTSLVPSSEWQALQPLALYSCSPICSDGVSEATTTIFSPPSSCTLGSLVRCSSRRSATTAQRSSAGSCAA